MSKTIAFTISLIMICVLGIINVAQTSQIMIKKIDVFATDDVVKVAINEVDSTSIDIYSDTGQLDYSLPSPFELSEIFSLRWSATGEKLAGIYSSTSPTIIIWDILSQQIDMEIPFEFARFVVWHPSNSNLILIGTGVTVNIYDLTSSQVIASSEATQGSIVQMKWSPDGTHIGVMTDLGELQILDGQNLSFITQFGDETIPIPEMLTFYFTFDWSPDGTRVAIYDLLNTQIDISNPTLTEIDISFDSFDTNSQHNEFILWAQDGILGADFVLDQVVLYDSSTGQYNNILSNTDFSRIFLDSERQSLLYMPAINLVDEPLFNNINICTTNCLSSPILSPISDTTNTTPTFTWSAVSGTESYLLSVSSTSTSVQESFIATEICSPTECSGTLSQPLTPDTYTASVQGLNTDATSEPSNVITFTIEEDVVSTPVPAGTFDVVSRIVQDDSQVSNFEYQIINTGQTPQGAITLRIFFTLDNGHPVSDYVFERYYDSSNATVISDPIQWDGDIYYYEISYNNSTLAVGANYELHGAIHLSDWSFDYDAQNDWWYSDITLSFASTEYMPLYSGGTLSVGLEPSPGTLPTQTPIPTSEPDPSSIVTIENRIEGPDSNQQSTFRYRLKNTSDLPQGNLVTRVYFTLDNGQPISNYVMETYYEGSGVATINAPVQVDDISYYYEIDYGATTLAPDSQWEFVGSFHLVDWTMNLDSSNDWWHTDVTSTMAETSYLPVYRDAIRLVGLEP